MGGLGSFMAELTSLKPKIGPAMYRGVSFNALSSSGYKQAERTGAFETKKNRTSHMAV